MASGSSFLHKEQHVEFSIKQSSPEKQRSGCVVVGIYEGGRLSAAAQRLDKAVAHHLSDLIARGDINGKAGSTLMLPNLANIAAERVLLVGLDRKSTRSELQSPKDLVCRL